MKLKAIAPTVALALAATPLLVDALVAGGFGGRGPLCFSSKRRLSRTRDVAVAGAGAGAAASEAAGADDKKSALLGLLARVPPNESTPRELTTAILAAVQALEENCPTPEADVLPRLAGNWELLWTAQDKASLPGSRRTNPFATFINPLEDQSYSNNPLGRSNPILPQNLQDGLEGMGVLRGDRTEDPNAFINDRTEDPNAFIKSTQAIDLEKGIIRNVVAFEANNPLPLFRKNGRTRGVITVDVRGWPNRDDKRKIDVKFDRCRVTLRNSPIDVNIPLGVVGPTGWLRTVYVDEEIRITRGHKGSVFVLSRTAAR